MSNWKQERELAIIARMWPVHRGQTGTRKEDQYIIKDQDNTKLMKKRIGTNAMAIPG